MGQEESLWKHAANPREAFYSPDDMWAAAIKYFKFCDDNPLYKTEQIKKPTGQIIIVEGVAVHPETMVDIPLKRAYTKSGFCLFSGVSQNYLRRMRNDFGKQTESYQKANQGWIECLNRIDDAIFTQQYEGGASGQLVAAIVARGIGLVDKVEVDQKTTTVKEIFKIGEQEFEL